MPGTHLSRAEERLIKKWGTEEGTICETACNTIPYLHSLEIEGDGLRGVSELQCFFRYPITAICGPNGVGKSTILSLCALAFSSPNSWQVYSAKMQTRPYAKTDKSNYTFSNFFDYYGGETPPNDTTIRWRYKENGAEIKAREFKIKGKDRSRPRKPERKVHFLSLSRILPPIEYAELRSRVGSTKFTDVNLDKFYLDILKEVLVEGYASVQNKKASDRHTFRVCSGTRGDYSAFNMGGGENALMLLMGALQEIGDGGLVIIEEIEACLHPEAQRRLAKALIKICTEKNLQIICSTHSETFLDALPREARLLITREGGGVKVYDKPSARYAMSRMLGDNLPEIFLFCEDKFAKKIIETSLPVEIRRRTSILDIGAKQVVIAQGVSALRVNKDQKLLCVVDGECNDTEVKKYIRSAANQDKILEPSYLILPGESADGTKSNLRPEQWILDQLFIDDYKEQFANILGVEVAAANDILTRVGAKMGKNHHSLGHCLSQEINLSIEDCEQKAIDAVVSKKHPAIEKLVSKVTEILNS